MLCFSWGIAVSGGIDAAHLVYIPIFPVLNGFISGKKGVILSVGYTTFLCFALVQLDKMNSIPNLAEPNPPELLCYQAIGASFFAGFLVLFHERRRNLGDKRLSIAHSLVSLEKTEVTKSESKLRAIFENVPVGIIKLDSSLKIIESNEAFASLLGYSKSEIHMKTVTDFCCPDNLNSSGSQLKLVPCHPRSSFRSREIKIHRSGKVIVCNVSSRFLEFDPIHGAVILSVIEDITEIEELRNKVETERQKSILSAKLASLGEMAAGIAHEINNPIAIIEGTVRALPNFLDSPSQLEVRLLTIQKSSERVSKIVKGLKKFSGSSTNQQRKRYSLNGILNECIWLTSFRANKFSVNLEISAPVDIGIMCHEIEIEQVIVNLINNSIDAIKNMSSRWIQIDLKRKDDFAVIKIKDSGTGIDPQVKNKLFQPFFTTKQVGEGVGIGLSISRGILKEHGSTIEILDQEHTCFEIRFPVHLQDNLHNDTAV